MSTSYVLSEYDVDALSEEGIDLDSFRVDSHRILYEILFNWIREASASLYAMSEARSRLMEATVYGSYRSVRSAIDATEKTVSAASELLLVALGQPDSPVQIKAALEEKETGSKKLTPIAEALSQLDGQSRENLRVAFLTLLKTARTIQNPIETATTTIATATDTAATKDDGTNVSQPPDTPATSGPVEKTDGSRRKSAKRKHRRLSKKSRS